jgi:hypothetical protein
MEHSQQNLLNYPRLTDQALLSVRDEEKEQTYSVADERVIQPLKYKS